MTWVYIIIGLVVVIGLVYWFKSKKEEDGGVDLSTPPTPPITPTPPETPQPTETETEESSSDEEKPM